MLRMGIDEILASKRDEILKEGVLAETVGAVKAAGSQDVRTPPPLKRIVSSG